MATPTLQYRLFNRAIDCAFVVIVCFFLCWLLFVCWVAIRLTSPGAAIFRQQRVGRDGKIFTCYKFRTMWIGERQAATHEMSANAITPVGRLMRRTKLDELPQFINLLRGEMSLVGPRPCLPSQKELLDLRYKFDVLTIRPGITGLAQVCGVDMSDPEKLARIDARYVEKRSEILDIKILLKTLRGSGSKDYVRY